MKIMENFGSLYQNCFEESTKRDKKRHGFKDKRTWFGNVEVPIEDGWNYQKTLKYQWKIVLEDTKGLENRRRNGQLI